MTHTGHSQLFSYLVTVRTHQLSQSVLEQREGYAVEMEVVHLSGRRATHKYLLLLVWGLGSLFSNLHLLGISTVS